MRRFFSQRRSLWIMAMVMAVLAMLAPSYAAFVSARPRWIVRSAVGLVAQPVKTITSRIRQSASLEIDRGDPRYIQQNYDALLKYNAQLREELDRARQEIDRLQVARQRLRLESPADFVFADVMAWNSNVSRQWITINQGITQGIRPGQTVADWYNFTLIGRVSDAGPGSATVELITSARSRPEVRFLPSGPVLPPQRPPIYKLEPDRNGKRLTVVVKADTAIQIGYLAHLVDPAWSPEARGLVVGRVTAVEPLAEDPYRFNQVIVEPVHDLTALSRVIVLVPAQIKNR